MKPEIMMGACEQAIPGSLGMVFLINQRNIENSGMNIIVRQPLLLGRDEGEAAAKAAENALLVLRHHAAL
jgi:hypothetical protein